MNVHDDFRDLAPLDPRRDPERWERMVAGVARAASPELERRAAAPRHDPLLLLAGWARPALSTAAALAAAAAALLLVGEPAATTAQAPGVADALGYPTAVAEWVEADATPSVEELVIALEETR